MRGFFRRVHAFRMEGSCIRAPFAACRHAVAKMGVKIYGATTFGPYCKVGGEVKNAVLFTNAAVAPGAKVIDSVLMPGVVVEEGAVVRNCIVAEGLVIPAGASIGNKDKIELISKKAQVK